MNSQLVSIIIPAYNSKKYLEETIRSVLVQSYTNIEVIIVDDGSTDGQIEIIHRMREADNRIRFVRKNNEGVSVARNTGFNHSKGLYIAFLDADDVWLPENLALKILKFENQDYGLVHSDAFLIDENSELKDGSMSGREGSLLKEMLSWKETQVPGPSSILVKREVIQTIGLFDTRLSTSADHDFFLRVASCFKIGRVAVPTWKYRLHSTNMHKIIPLMEKDVLKVYEKATANHLFEDFWFERRCYANMYLILAASWAGDGKNRMRAIYFLILAFKSHPYSFIDVLKRLTKKWN